MNGLIAYIDKTLNRLKEEEKNLASADRKDESNLVKIQINVYGICKTVYQVFSQSKEGKVLEKAYLDKLDNLAEGWRDSQKKAQEFGMVEKTVIEGIKLQVIEDIRQQYFVSLEERK